MTEDDARRHMCPFMAVVGAISTRTAKDVGIRCIASDCMMYRTYDQSDAGDDGGIYISKHGYCGLANKP